MFGIALYWIEMHRRTGRDFHRYVAVEHLIAAGFAPMKAFAFVDSMAFRRVG